jgi:hypothetical protein
MEFTLIDVFFHYLRSCLRMVWACPLVWSAVVDDEYTLYNWSLHWIGLWGHIRLCGGYVVSYEYTRWVYLF